MKSYLNDIRLKINLPPKKPIADKIEELLRLIIVEYKWIDPKKYGHIDSDIKIDKSSFDLYKKDLLKVYNEENDLTLGRGNECVVVYPVKDDFFGDVYFSTARYPKIDPICEQVVTIMKLFKSPLSYSGTEEMYSTFLNRRVERENYSEELITVKSYAHGLTNAFWRMWFGKEYIDFFGKVKLDTAPAFSKKYEDDIYFIQLFESPFDWNTEEGMKITEAFKNHVGKDSFYDPADPEKKLKAPDFSHLLK
jgi:hypothetical protein